jgi:hypothetical protein
MPEVTLADAQVDVSEEQVSKNKTRAILAPV